MIYQILFLIIIIEFSTGIEKIFDVLYLIIFNISYYKTAKQKIFDIIVH